MFEHLWETIFSEVNFYPQNPLPVYEKADVIASEEVPSPKTTVIEEQKVSNKPVV